MNTKKILIGLGIVAALMVVAVYLLTPFLKKLIANKMEEKLASNFFYHYTDLEVSILERSISFDSLKFAFPKDSSKFEYVGKADRFSVENINLISLFFSKNLSLGEIIIKAPKVTTKMKATASSKDTSSSVDLEDLNLYSFIEGGINRLELGNLTIEEGDFVWQYGSQDKVWRAVKGMHLEVLDLELDSTIAAENNGWFILDNFNLKVAHLMENLKDSLHYITTDALQMSYKDSSIRIVNLKMLPIYNRSELPQVLDFQTDIFTLNTDTIQMNHINLDHLIYKNSLFVGEVLVNSAEMNVYRDKSVPFPHTYKELPIVSLMKMKFEMTLDSLKINRANIAYEQLNADVNESGIVRFQELSATLYHLTSSKEQIEKYPHTILKAKTNLMGLSKLDVYVDFDLKDKSGGHHLKGSLDEFDLKSLNKIILPLTFIKVEEGSSSKLYFDFFANTNITKGDMRFYYDDLNVSVLDKDAFRDDQSEDRKFFTSFLANTFVVRKSNPKGNTLRIGAISTNRNKEKSIFNLWWEGISSGMASTILNIKNDAKEVEVNKD